ncbi:MAG: hypothetical protein C4547_09895 [Phycisphaerales bacterium]|nr:MAG: hypothetical protein C4547_09895 [Phycisphaerales bacterium]
MHEAIYARLIATARAGGARGTVTYGEIAPLADLDMGRPDHRARIGEILDEISAHEHDHGRPLLSAVVVHAGPDGGMPGRGFFDMAKRVGAQRTNEDDVAFFAQELTRVLGFWRGPGA